MAEKITNDFATVLTNSLTDTATTMTVASAPPAALLGGSFRMRVENPDPMGNPSGINAEYVNVVDVVGTTLTVERAAEDPGRFPAIAHPTGSVASHILTAASLVALIGGGGSAGPSLVMPNNQISSYTLALGDAGKAVEMNADSAMTLTVPSNSAVPLPIGTVIQVARVGTGTVTISTGAGVTINSRGGLLGISQYGSVSLRKRATDSWLLVGDLA